MTRTESAAAPTDQATTLREDSTPSGLVLADDFAFPLEVVTETLILLGKRGAGKTATASVLVEELVGAGLPVCVIDPLGVWWGLRASVGHTQRPSRCQWRCSRGEVIVVK
jgi:hypothetical protein